MGNQTSTESISTNNSTPSTSSSNEEKPKLKPCCACPETRQARDLCMVEKGEENCKDLIEAHKKCMRDLGFNI